VAKASGPITQKAAFWGSLSVENLAIPHTRDDATGFYPAHAGLPPGLADSTRAGEAVGSPF